jgi:hypothetical protein
MPARGRRPRQPHSTFTVDQERSAVVDRHAGRLLTEDPALSAGHSKVQGFVAAAYSHRTGLVHGDHAVPVSMTFLPGIGPTISRGSLRTSVSWSAGRSTSCGMS